MQSIAFTAPLLPGKTATAREAMHSCMQGERKGAYDASRQRLGIARESVWIQQTPGGDFAIVYLEADDLQAVFVGRASIGVVTSSMRSPTLKKAIALARVDVTQSEIGTALEIGRLDCQLKRLKATVVRFPFYDPEKTRVKA